jgi:hypothetical protein
MQYIIVIIIIINGSPAGLPHVNTQSSLFLQESIVNLSLIQSFYYFSERRKVNHHHQSPNIQPQVEDCTRRKSRGYSSFIDKFQ